MRMEQNEGAAPGGAHTSKNHSWGRPVPGHGAVRVCRKCGEKRTEYTKRSECIGKPVVGMTETTHDYEPI